MCQNAVESVTGGFSVVIIGELLGYESYHKFTLIDRVVFWYKARNELDFFEVVEN